MKPSQLYSIMAIIMFIHSVYRMFALGLFTTWTVNIYGIPHMGVIDNDFGGGLVSFGISVYFGLQLLVMAHDADESEHSLDEVTTGCPT